MRVRSANGSLAVRAICGPHVVILAWDVREADWTVVTQGLLGFVPRFTIAVTYLQVATWRA